MKKITYYMSLAILLLACDKPKVISPAELKPIIRYPSTERLFQKDSYFGTIVEDPYRWLENDSSKKTTSWVNAENKVTAAYIKQIPYREAIKERLEVNLEL